MGCDMDMPIAPTLNRQRLQPDNAAPSAGSVSLYQSYKASRLHNELCLRETSRWYERAGRGGGGEGGLSVDGGPARDQTACQAHLCLEARPGTMLVQADSNENTRMGAGFKEWRCEALAQGASDWGRTLQGQPGMTDHTHLNS